MVEICLTQKWMYSAVVLRKENGYTSEAARLCYRDYSIIFRKKNLSYTSSRYSYINSPLLASHTQPTDKNYYVMWHVWFDKWRTWVTRHFCYIEAIEKKIPLLFCQNTITTKGSFVKLAGEEGKCLYVSGGGEGVKLR